MSIYILVLEPYHDVDNRPNVVAQSEEKQGELYLIYKFEIQ